MRDPDTLGLVLEAEVDGSSVSVHIAQEALQEASLETCRRIAEKKLLVWVKSGIAPPRRIDVTVKDLETA